jgi:hypothetical protein
MFNLSNLKIVKGDSRDSCGYSFVGIKRDSKTNDLEFWLPLNFNNFPENNHEQIQKFFFKLYKTLKIFTKNQKQTIHNSKNDRDGLLKASGGLKISYQNSEEIICYGKIAMLESIIDACDEMAIASIIRKSINSSDLKFDKISKYFDKAIYSQEDDSFYIENMQSERNLISINSTSVIELFCFIYSEIKKELSEEYEISNEVNYLSLKFKETHLTSTSSIFGESFDHTIGILKQVLDDIHRMTSYKDGDFWLFFDAIEKFLYGEYFPNEDTGEYWGINNFWAIWEDMCQTYSFAHERECIAYADSQKHGNELIGAYGRKIYLNKKLLSENIFYLEYQNKKRYIRPDTVIINKSNAVHNFDDEDLKRLMKCTITTLSTNSKRNKEEIKIVLTPTNDILSIGWTTKLIDQLNKFTKRKKYGYSATFDQFDKGDYNSALQKTIEIYKSRTKDISNTRIIDYKYHSEIEFDKKNDKLAGDIKKQHVYELALKAWSHENDMSYHHEFIIPFFDEETHELRIELAQPEILKNSKITLIGFNFSIIQDFYIKHEVQ